MHKGVKFETTEPQARSVTLSKRSGKTLRRSSLLGTPKPLIDPVEELRSLVIRLGEEEEDHVGVSLDHV